VHGRLRINVVKSDCVIIFPDNFRWNLSGDDFFENGHGVEWLESSGKSAHPGRISNAKHHLSKVLVRPDKLSFSVANNRASLPWDRLQRLVFLARSRQSPRAKRRRRVSTSSLRANASRKAAGSIAGGYRSRFQSGC
jgi:hypothetical protein